jgi:3D (Asp-Asp-Asp) domain-containing protein
VALPVANFWLGLHLSRSAVRVTPAQRTVAAAEQRVAGSRSAFRLSLNLGVRHEGRMAARSAGKGPRRVAASGGWTTVWVTAYCPRCRVCETDGITATGRPADRSHGLAVAAHGRRAAPVGARVYLPRFGWLPVDDVGGGVGPDQLDLRLRSHQAACRWGRRQMKVRIASGRGQA